MSTPRAGDPFSQAYSGPRNNGRKQRPKNERLSPHSPARARGLGDADPNKYAGYGISLPGAQCAPNRVDALTDCLQALREILGETFQLADLAPWIHPPYRARSLSTSQLAVVGPTAAADAAANAVAVALAAAASGPGFTVPVIEVSATSDAATLFTVSPEQGEMARVRSWGIDSGSAGDKAIFLRLQGTTVGGLPSAPDPFISGAVVSQHQDVFALVPGGGALSVRVGLHDLTTPTLVTFGIEGWFWPVNKRVDSKEGTLLRSGYGVCR